MFVRRSLRLLSVAALCGALTTLAACGDEEETDNNGGTTDAGGNADGGGGGVDAGGGGGTDGGGGGGTCSQPQATHQDALYRVNSVSITTPEGVGAFLQAQMQTDIEANILSILVEVKDFEAECGATTFRLTGNGGTWVEEEDAYTWMPEAQVPGFVPSTIDDAGAVTNLELLSLDFPIIEPGSERIVLLPVVDLEFEGVILDANGDISIVADLRGALLLEQIQDIAIAITPGADPRPLVDVLGMANMNYPADAEEKTGWALGAALGLVPVTPASTHPDL